MAAFNSVSKSPWCESSQNCIFYQSFEILELKQIAGQEFPKLTIVNLTGVAHLKVGLMLPYDIEMKSQIGYRLFF